MKFRKRRVHREIDKLVRLGRYWDLLRLLEREGLVAESPREYQEAWQAVIRRALQQESEFEEFCSEVETLETFPEIPDLLFLKRLKGFMEARNSPGEVLELKGLSPDAERLRSNFAGFTASASSEEKLRGLLAKFAAEPDKITRRYFDQLAGLIPVRSLASVVQRIGEWIVTARSFNQKAAVSRGAEGVNLHFLERLDHDLSLLSRSLPQSLADLVLHPFIHNVALLCARLAPQIDSGRAARLVQAMPFLLPRVAGERFEAIEKELLIYRGEWLDASGTDLDALLARAEAGGLEEKLLLLKGVRLKVQALPAKEPELEALKFLFEEEGDELAEEEPFQASDLARALLSLHHAILREIASRQATLPAREKKELTRVMEPVLFHDFDFIIDTLENADALLKLLDAAIEAGCSGTRLALLAVLAGGHFRKPDLRKRAENVLDQAVPPTQQDMEWLAKSWSELYYPEVQSLKPLLIRYKDEPKLFLHFSSQLCQTLEFNLLENVFKKEVLRLPKALEALMGMMENKEPKVLRRELSRLAEFEVFNPVRDFQRCYADNRLSVESHLCWLGAVYAMKPQGVWEFALADLNRYAGLKEQGRGLLPTKPVDALVADKAEALLLFMTEHQEALAALSADLLDSLLEGILICARKPLAHHTLFLRLEKLLADRQAGGDPSVRPLLDRLRRTLQALARADKRTRTPRKSRR